jgi:pimeloyl-ACP methyl ester carboxylesterase
VLIVSTVVVVGPLGVVPAASAPSMGAKTLAWTPCFPREGHFQCADLAVPLDYAQPNGPTIDIAVIRQRAADPARRIGSLLLNPGGPGGSGVDLVRFAGPFLFNDEVQARFDLVGFDPRGINRSRQLRCFQDPSQWAPLFHDFVFPTTAAEERQQKASDTYLATACAARGGAILDHMATADVARDMDQLRQAVGDDKLNYVGYSYGTYLGVTYANLFPNNFRALVVDGVLDPIQWSTGTPATAGLPFSTRLRSDAGAQATLEEFFRLCDEAGRPACAFAPRSAKRYAALANELRRDGPITLVDPVSGAEFLYNYSVLISDTLGAMGGSPGWPDFARFLSFIERNDDPAGSGAALVTLHHTIGLDDPTFARYTNEVEGFPGVSCTDSDNPSSYSAWPRAGRSADAQFGYFGRAWTWVSSPCALWPGHDDARYMGPFTAATTSPVLVVGNQFDPATRYEGAVTVSQLLPNSRLLTVHGWGHTSLFLSTCADAATASYLVDLALPPAGTVCEQDTPVFGPATAAGASEAAIAAGRARAAQIVHTVNLPAGVARR